MNTDKNTLYVIRNFKTGVMMKVLFGHLPESTQEAIKNAKLIGDPDPKAAWEDFARSNVR